jgi:hypothetical protein
MSRKTATQVIDRWELGSEFHWMGLPAAPSLSWPVSAAWYSLARHAVIDLATELKAQAIWVPEYFCHDVAENWRASLPVRLYRDDPRRAEPDWKTLQAGPRDLVIAVNYFGVREGKAWGAWRRKHDCVLVEDHSHDPFSPWALKSRADFAFCSLRKTLPVPDGAILWSPHKLPLLSVSEGTEWTGSALKLAAMMWKSDYLAGRTSLDAKTTYRGLQADGEKRLERSAPSTISPWSAKYLENGVPVEWRNRRSSNAAALLKSLEGWTGAQPLFKEWPANATPFAAVLVFPSQSVRDEYRAYLSSRGVYCPIHWEAPGSAAEEVKELASCVLTVPTDQRYTTEDMERVAAILRSKQRAGSLTSAGL